MSVFTAEKAAAIYEPRPGDAPAPLFASRVGVCAGCLWRRAHRCTQADQLVAVLARAASPSCPIREWPDSPDLESTFPTVDDLAQVFEETTPVKSPEESAAPPPAPRVLPRLGVSVAIIAHNYGRFLKQAVDSVLAQTVPPDELVIVDDASTDDTPDIVRECLERPRAIPLRSIRGKWGHASGARAVAYESTKAPVVMFLDADDAIGSNYLAEGLATLHRSESVGVVYSDLDRFGDATGRLHHPDDRPIEQQNFAHAGSLVRRAAIDSLPVAEAFPEGMGLLNHHDWHLWRAIARAGWRFRWSPGQYRYRQHGASQSDLMRRAEAPYHELASLWWQPVTLFVPLSGRVASLVKLRQTLDQVEWPRERLRLVLCDTSQRPGFQAALRSWLQGTDYQDVRIYSQTVAPRGVADEDRHDPEVCATVRRAMLRIYSRAIREASTEYLWILEDDVTPPANALQRLLQGMGPRVGSVSGAYRSRLFPDQWVAWTSAGKPYTETPPAELLPTGGNGFGCVLLRRSVAIHHPFTNHARTADYDPNFYDWLARQQYAALVDWRVTCGHD